ncbi:MAG: peptidase M24 [Porphyromonadaceae bacterium CG2_30_38_12]|nr:MAG: peptidase M24 [Porphyromonadaceae bacterium CG2_30_38_12]
MIQIANRILKLRENMERNGVAAYIVPGTDPHASEYIASCWKEREWISGFNGSAGTVAFTLHKAGLWTDSRYFLQAAAQLEGTGIELMKQGLTQTPELISWVIEALKPGERVGVNPQFFSVNAYAEMKNALTTQGLQLISIDLLAEVWVDRAPLPAQQIFVFDTHYAGASAEQKLDLLRSEMVKANADYVVLSALDDVAWLYNIRGNDVDYNPVVIAYSLVSLQKAVIFIDNVKLTDSSKAYLQSQGVEIAPYLSISEALSAIKFNDTCWIDGSKLNESLYEAIPTNVKKRNAMSPVFKMKSVKNKTEIAGVRTAMIRDGVALTKFFRWLEASVVRGDLTELTISQKLLDFRKQQANFMGESFGTIAGYKAHGAIVHYSATPDSDATLQPEGILLLDSGGQYLDGTTDITRTVSFGKTTQQQKNDFTLVLKGHIALATVIFLQGTRGSQLDILARKALWDNGLNYGHGTGHGVGHFLNVHEGPQSIRMDENPTVLLPGMIISNEPGMYRTGEYGIRIENLVHVVPAVQTEYGDFLEFETLTLFPLDKNLIEITLLNMAEKAWLDAYHAKVYNALSPLLDADEQAWLSEKCKPVLG